MKKGTHDGSNEVVEDEELAEEMFENYDYDAEGSFNDEDDNYDFFDANKSIEGNENVESTFGGKENENQDCEKKHIYWFSILPFVWKTNLIF